MSFADKKFVIGIDLGTTNCSVSFVDLLKPEKKNQIKTFFVPQLTGQGEFSKANALPSFLYIPGEYDISKEALQHPWKKDKDQFPGIFARDHGAKIPSRLVSSAKSWLCNPRVDKEGNILPWGSEGVVKVSPVTATAEYLKHIKNAWNNSVKDEDMFLENQYIVITIPASFDETAREFTLKAAVKAGLTEVTLLEEPLAAFYSWLVKHEQDWQKHVNPGELVMVCDVGGGTTDFTLISLRESEGSPRFERLAVGDHLMLGGDNIDCSAARLVASKFKTQQSLDKDKWQSLCFKCRQAKEEIFERKEDKVRITLKGKGRSLISGTLAADLTEDDLSSLLKSKFFTDISMDDAFKNDFPKGFANQNEKIVSEFGLLREKEESISRHIIMFLENQRENIKRTLGRGPMPDLILFNGGALKPKFIQERIRDSIRSWFGCENIKLPGVLDNKDLDLAVGLGASYYGLVKQGVGIKVGSGSPRSYYFGIEGKGADSGKAVCVVERGLDEGTDIELSDMEFGVLANQPVSFDVFSSSFRSGDCAGDVVEVDSSLTPMPSLETIISFGKADQKKSIPVKIKASYTEMGSLEMSCDSVVSDHKWRLQFQLRTQKTGSSGVKDGEILPQSTIDKACLLVEKSFSENSDNIAGLVKSLESLVEKKKIKWPLGFLRSIVDQLIVNKRVMTISPEHEIRWLNLAGFCMRPGFGDVFDDNRIKKLWKIYLEGLKHPKHKQSRLEWFVFIRRIAGGFNAGQQRQLFQNVSQYVLKNRGGKLKISPHESVEVWMALANLERLLVKDKVVLAKTLLNELKPGKTLRQAFWSLSRIGAREPLYGSIDRVVPPIEVSNWIRRVLKLDWKENDSVEDMIVQLARKTDDRTRDLDQDFIEELIEWLYKRGAKKSDVNLIKKRVVVEINEQKKIFGESLPSGLMLKNS